MVTCIAGRGKPPGIRRRAGTRMQRQIPIRGTTVAGVFDQRIFGRQRVADRGTRQIGHLQMNRGDPRQTLIVGV